MRLDLRDILDRPGARAPFSCVLDLSALEFYGVAPFLEPVAAEGFVLNKAGVVTLTASLKTTLHLVCDRCATPFLRESVVPVETTFIERDDKDEVSSLQARQAQAEFESADSGDMFFFTGEFIELDDVLLPAAILGVEQKNLCRPDCLGLCPRCGHNANEGSCGCGADVPDPRLARLADWFKDAP